jgi:DNA mismatch repair protein MutL
VKKKKQMGVIHKLDPHLVNQIAAGEVIERPASVVKELMENALDAEASQIDVAVEAGGGKLIRVQDNGCGMAAEDLALAVASHATSKLAASEDLDHIATLGFRGEALASVGSVSEMTVLSRRPGDVEGHVIAVAAGRAEEVRVAGGPPGTIIEVRNLFYSIPARRKFLKSEATELGHVVEAVANLALAYPHVAMRLTHNGRLVHDLPAAQGVRERVAAFFGADLAAGLIEISGNSPAGQLWGLVAPPSESRASTKWQFLYVNGRYVRDRSLLHAVREAYRGLVEANRQPVVFLYLTVPPEDVDVNVHPSKIEVRLRNGQQIYREILGTLREKFLTTDLAPRVSTGFEEGGGATGPRLTLPAAEGGGSAEERQERVRQSLADFFRRPTETLQPRFSYGPGGRTETAARSEISGLNPSPGPEGPSSPKGEGLKEEAGPRRRVLQLHNTYLVAETEDGMLIVDQHALHERVLYEELRRRIEAGALESQRLLIPAVIDVTEGERAFLEEHRQQLARLGIEFELFGSQAVGIQAFPAMLAAKTPPERVVRDLLDWAAAHGSKPAVEDVVDELMHRLACRGAVKSGDVLAPEEIEALLATRYLAEQTATCPHGRPTTLVLTRQEIERQFKRDYRSTEAKEDETIPF